VDRSEGDLLAGEVEDWLVLARRVSLGQAGLDRPDGGGVLAVVVDGQGVDVLDQGAALGGRGPGRAGELGRVGGRDRRDDAGVGVVEVGQDVGGRAVAGEPVGGVVERLAAGGLVGGRVEPGEGSRERRSGGVEAIAAVSSSQAGAMRASRSSRSVGM
jgi:hypothetical protein